MFNLVLSIWSIIIGGWIIFIDGDGWCIACNGTIGTILGIVSIVLGLAVLFNSMGARGAVAERG